MHLKRINYFVEGIQGAGKSTLVQQISGALSDYKVFREGDFSPVELAWCAYTTEKQYRDILEDYPSLAAEIKEKTVEEGACKIISYTQILTDLPDFHKNLEKFEIYNGNLDKESFEKVVLERFGRWRGEGQIFECSIFQNIIENQMLYLMMDEEEILSFYRRLKNILNDKPYRIIYLDVDNIPDAIDVIRKERSDDKGNELWFPLMARYMEESPYGRTHTLAGLEGLLMHLEKRKALEHRIMDEIFRDNTVIVRSKKDTLDDVMKLLYREQE
ncbi:MAG: deoxynucleoside kinase [Lachnospiraceae bacterium]|nr:deoxynucleoside kinase [Lachnospiraceae bacterium]